MTTSVVETVSAVDPTPSPPASAGPPGRPSRSRSRAPSPSSRRRRRTTPRGPTSPRRSTGATARRRPPGRSSARFDRRSASSRPTSTGPADLFQVSGGHTYATAGTYTVKVTLTDQSATPRPSRPRSRSSPARWRSPRPRRSAATVDPSPDASDPDQDYVTLGTLTDFRGTVAGADSTVTVDWGDGSAPTAATRLTRCFRRLSSIGPADRLRRRGLARLRPGRRLHRQDHRQRQPGRLRRGDPTTTPGLAGPAPPPDPRFGTQLGLCTYGSPPATRSRSRPWPRSGPRRRRGLRLHRDGQLGRRLGSDDRDGHRRPSPDYRPGGQDRSRRLRRAHLRQPRPLLGDGHRQRPRRARPRPVDRRRSR